MWEAGGKTRRKPNAHILWFQVPVGHLLVVAMYECGVEAAKRVQGQGLVQVWVRLGCLAAMVRPGSGSGSGSASGSAPKRQILTKYWATRDGVHIRNHKATWLKNEEQDEGDSGRLSRDRLMTIQEAKAQPNKAVVLGLH